MSVQTPIIAAFLTIALLLSIGTAVYQGLENWSLVDALYFTAMTLTTVGYGDIVPSTDVSKIFTVIYSFAGIAIFFATFGAILGQTFTKTEVNLINRFARRFSRKRSNPPKKVSIRTIKKKK